MKLSWGESQKQILDLQNQIKERNEQDHSEQTEISKKLIDSLKNEVLS
jgi:hypothetical protein